MFSSVLLWSYNSYGAHTHKNINMEYLNLFYDPFSPKAWEGSYNLWALLQDGNSRKAKKEAESTWRCQLSVASNVFFKASSMLQGGI